MTDSFEVRSPDGTPLRVWVGGAGPPIVLVHGSFTDHTAWAVPSSLLDEHFTTFAMDRRGFGSSGDGPEYAIEREFEDVSAVVGAVATTSQRPVVLWGHSYGANCAMGGADLAADVQHLILYEPSLGIAYPPDLIEEAEAALASGDPETVVSRMLFDVLEMTPPEIAALRSRALASDSLRSPHGPQGGQGRAELGVPTWPIRRSPSAHSLLVG